MVEYEILDPYRHKRLIENCEELCRVANVPEGYIDCSMKGFCSDEEIEVVKGFSSMIESGVVFKDGDDILRKMQLIAAVLLRNYKDARVWTVGDILKRMADGDFSYPTYVLVPNFFISDFDTKGVPEWKIPVLMDWVMNMMIKGKKTCFYIQDFPAMKMVYGKTMAELIENNYKFMDV